MGLLAIVNTETMLFLCLLVLITSCLSRGLVLAFAISLFDVSSPMPDLNLRGSRTDRVKLNCTGSISPLASLSSDECQTKTQGTFSVCFPIGSAFSQGQTDPGNGPSTKYRAGRPVPFAQGDPWPFHTPLKQTAELSTPLTFY